HIAFPVYSSEARRVHPGDLTRNMRLDDPGRQPEIVLTHLDVRGLLGQVLGDPAVVKQLIRRRNDKTNSHLGSLAVPSQYNGRVLLTSRPRGIYSPHESPYRLV